MRRAAFLLLLVLLAPAPAAAGDGPDLSYSIKEARAYMLKASLDEDAFENLPECTDEEAQEYDCDYSRYNHKPNCPKRIEIGARGKAPEPKPPPRVEPFSGGSGDSADSGPSETPPPQSSPVRYNRIITSASVSRLLGTREAAGFGGETWVDLSGVRDSAAFSQTNAFTQQAKWEERCDPREEAKNGDSYAHVMSRSDESIETYHLSECHKRECAFEAPTVGTFGASAERARTIVHLEEKKSDITGSISAVVEDLSYGEGAFTIESLRTFVEFSSDGTQQGLKWAVASTASGAKFGGQPVSLPPGRMVSLPGFSVGVAAPFVEATEDGSRLTVVAAGLTIAHEKQAMFFGGAELYASFGEDAALPTFGGLGPERGSGATDLGSGGGFGGGAGGVSVGGGFAGRRTPAEEPPPVAAEPQDEVLVYEVATGRGAVGSMLALGAIAAFLMVGRWLQRFAWGRRLYRAPPLKAIDWIYRAFVKT
ncbi:MAG: hypothetical protein ACRDJJ_03525 [Actinomycetota bacterium]